LRIIWFLAATTLADSLTFSVAKRDVALERSLAGPKSSVACGPFAHRLQTA
jgi:hypothetical protein